MNTHHRTRGMTLVELMIATAVGAVLSAAAVQLFSSLVRYSRVTAMTTELNDRVRLAREIITHDFLGAGYYWRKEAITAATGADATVATNLDVVTGSFGIAGKASTMGTWPRVPVSGADNAGANQSDIVYLIVPNGGLVGANFNPGHAAYQCRTGANMTLTSHASTSPEFANMGAGRVIVGTSFNFIFLSTLPAAVNAAGAFTVAPLAAAIQTPAIPATPTYTDECQVAGKTAGDPLPGRLLVYPVDGVAWMATQGDLRRCKGTTAAAGPLTYGLGSCGDSQTVLGGFVDLQVRWRFLKGTLDASGVPSSAQECIYDNPSLLVDPHVSINCGGAQRKRRIAEDSTMPMLRFIGYEVGVVARSLKEDFKDNLNRGRRPALFNRAAGGTDSYRYSRHTWKLAAPNFYIF